MAENPIRPTDDNARTLARALLRTARSGSLATLEAGSGHPFASLVSLATDIDGTPLILTSRLSGHTGNLAADPRASLLLAQGGRGDPLAHPRITLLVRGRTIARDTDEGARVRRRFLARQPKAELYVDFGDFAFWALDIERASLNAGFGRAYDLARADIVTDMAGAEPMIEVEAGAVEHMNADHAEALALYATRLLGAPAGAWRCTGLDPDGLDLALGDATLRLAFPERVSGAGPLRMVLRRLAEQARAAA